MIPVRDGDLILQVLGDLGGLIGQRVLLVGGGVAANSVFRAGLTSMAARTGVELIVAPREYCTDNAAMGAIGWELLDRGVFSPLDVDVVPGLVRKQR